MSLHAIQGHLRASIARRAQRVGPFLVTYETDTASAGSNYAVPDDGATPTAADIAALVAHFAAVERTPRLEYVGPVPAVDAALAAAGFGVEARHPLMTVAPGDVVEPPTGSPRSRRSAWPSGTAGAGSRPPRRTGSPGRRSMSVPCRTSRRRANRSSGLRAGRVPPDRQPHGDQPAPLLKPTTMRVDVDSLRKFHLLVLAAPRQR